MKYQRLIPPIDVSFCFRDTFCSWADPDQIEILTAGEEGPRRLDGATVMMVGRIPFLTITEFIRAKIKAWSMCVEPITFLCHVGEIADRSVDADRNETRKKSPLP